MHVGILRLGSVWPVSGGDADAEAVFLPLSERLGLPGVAGGRGGVFERDGGVRGAPVNRARARVPVDAGLVGGARAKVLFRGLVVPADLDAAAIPLRPSYRLWDAISARICWISSRRA